MEGLKKRSLFLAAVFIVFGGWIVFTPRTLASSPVNEDWMADKAPEKVGAFRSVSGPQGPAYTYKMDETTYNELKPLGILARRYNDGTNEFDVVLIASNRKDSFHDPRVCFTAQQWEIQYEEQRKIETSRGKIPITLAHMTHSGKEVTKAAFFYRSPDGFFSTPQDLSIGFLKRVLVGKSDFEGVFYRFMPMGNSTEEEFLDFIRSYLEAAAKTSGGYF